MERAMIDWTKPVRHIGTKQPGRVLCTDGPGEYPVAVWWEHHDGPCSYTPDGRANIDWHAEVENIPQPPTVLWANYYKDGGGLAGSFDFKEDADRFANRLARTALFRIEISPDSETLTGERVE
jgi:hypothetical protein